ncbi:MAG: LptF/LptG family permease [Saprospiraceae bacterium]
MKTIDKYLIKQFIGPFIATFFIALFVLLMQFIWVYVDDMVGKGAGFGLVLEIIFYNSISLIPWALPIAILISSVMVMGNLGERYELASLKSAGVSLIRVILPMLYFAIGVTFFSFFSSNNLVPMANLKFKSRLHDIRTQKPTLNLEEGVFNEDFKGFIIHIGKKENDDRTIRDVIIYDHQDYNKGKFSMITAESGEMYMTSDNVYFVMNLKNGYHYQEGEKAKKGEEEKYTFTRTKFDEWKKVFDTGEFNIDLTEEERFKNHYTMLSVRQLWNAIDSIDNRIGSYNARLDEYVQKAFYPLKKEFLEKRKIENAKKLKAQKQKAKDKLERKKLEKKENEKQDSMAPKLDLKDANPINSKKIETTQKTIKSESKPPKPKKTKKKTTNKIEKEKAKKARSKAIQKRKEEAKIKKEEKRKAEAIKKEKSLSQILKQEIEKPLKEFDTFYNTFPEAEQGRFSLKERAKTTARGILNQAEAIQRSINPKNESRVKHVFVLYSKFSFALVCCVFLFIGAPMGAIVRKGGFGYPLLIAILFFMMFIVLNILFQKLAESFVLPAEIAVWCPILILLPISYILTTRALKDKKILNFDQYTSKIISAFRYLQSRFQKSSTENTN